MIRNYHLLQALSAKFENIRRTMLAVQDSQPVSRSASFQPASFLLVPGPEPSSFQIASSLLAPALKMVNLQITSFC